MNLLFRWFSTLAYEINNDILNNEHHAEGEGMSLQDQINQVTSGLTELQLTELLDFARFLRLQQERNDWRAGGQAQLARAYGPDEPEYTEADLRTQGRP